MKLFIRELIVWPADTNLAPRVIQFDLQKVSVITGWSATGKSSIIAIIDYVLGAGSCAIPVGVIRDKSSWYGLRIDTDVGPMRLAREKPDGRQVSDKFWLQQGADVEAPLPIRPMANARTERIKQMFDDLSRLSNLGTDPEGRGYSHRASFRDMSAFNFLPQHIVANPYTMFFKADTSEHREKLRNVTPLALGVITNEDLVRLHTLHLLRDELRKTQEELRLRRDSLERWRANATGAYYRAQELGLLPTGDLPANLQGIIDILRRVVEAGGQTVTSTGRISAAVERLEAMRSMERDLDRLIADKKRRLRRLKSLRSTVSDYDAVLEDQQHRVRGAGWFAKAIVANSCVLCGSDTTAAQDALNVLAGSIAEIEELSDGTSFTTPIVDKEIIDVQEGLLNDERNLLDVRRTRQAAGALLDAEQGRGQSLENVYRFIGSTEQALQMLGEVEGESGLQTRVDELRLRVGTLEDGLDLNRQRERNEKVGMRISKYIEKFIEYLGVEGAEGQPILDFRELNLKFQREGEKKADYLWEIGSGENWMAYHLATMLALHGVFMGRKESNPVPSFLVIDQPSQVYFPSDTYETYVKEVESESRPGVRLGDLDRTRQIFRAVARAHRRFAGTLQVIILDHADREAWGAEENIVGVANWREGEDWLIPKAWFD